MKSIYFIEKNVLKKYVDKFNSINTNKELSNKWNSIINDFNANQKKLNRANRNIGVLTNLVNDNELTFEQILAGHKGKLVFVDLWASWCSPCRQEIPYMKELKSKFKKTDLQVVEISIDKDYAAWERASKVENIHDNRNSFIIAIANWEESNLYKNYAIKTIPRYLLFNRKSEIITDEAPRPSNIELEKLLKASM